MSKKKKFNLGEFDYRQLIELILDKKLKNYVSYDPEVVWEYTYWDKLENKIRTKLINLRDKKYKKK